MKRILIASALLMTCASAQDVAGNCLKIAQAKMSGVTIVKAEMIAAGSINQPTNWGEQKFDTHCLVEGKINERKGIDGKTYAIGFEMRMPVKWNGKFLFQGGGGSDGKLLPAIGLTRAGSADVNPLSRGYAVASIDGGHRDEVGVPNGGYLFGLDPQARADYGYNGVVQTTYVAKYLIANTYGKQPAKTYFAGCSNGGRQALKAIMTIPEEFDGIIAQAPAMQLTAAPVDALRWAQSFMKFAPLGKDGKPDLGSAFTNEELQTVSRGILDKCDALDGVKDGMVYNTKACKFDATMLSCQAGQNASCIPHYKAVALNEAYSGVWPKAKKVVYAHWPWDPGLVSPGFRFWRLGTSGSVPNNSATLNLIPGSFAYSMQVPPTKAPNLQEYARGADFEADYKKNYATDATFKESAASMIDSRDPNIDKFINKGGKMILTHGMSDGIFSANDTISYMGKLKARYGEKRMNDHARLFLQPGMGHCSGGPSADDFDLVAALENWVEKAKAPDQIIAKARANVTSYAGRSRPMCAYPKYAHYTGNGSAEEAANFECRN